ncbi:MAG: isochorismatase family protein [Terrimicrobiaceae bacterium]|jgi:hypothetical protein|nr:isochorismatase family protein [Terrimicrobiaceae bacterium]
MTHPAKNTICLWFDRDAGRMSPLTLASAPHRGSSPRLSAIEAGYEVFVVTDASGTFNKTTRDAAWSRMSAAGAQLMTWFGVACELHRDWRNDVEGLGALLSNHVPNYRCLINATVPGKRRLLNRDRLSHQACRHH